MVFLADDCRFLFCLGLCFSSTYAPERILNVDYFLGLVFVRTHIANRENVFFHLN